MSSYAEKQMFLADRIVDISDDLNSFLLNAKDVWVSEDLVYRFWHQSFKVYALQEFTARGAELIKSVALDSEPLHPFFEEIVSEGTGVVFEMSHNDDWTKHTRPIVEAFWHVVNIIDMMVKHAPDETSLARSNDSPDVGLPNMHFISSGWALVLEIFNLR
jgi:hypothetical protein